MRRTIEHGPTPWHREREGRNRKRVESRSRSIPRHGGNGENGAAEAQNSVDALRRGRRLEEFHFFRFSISTQLLPQCFIPTFVINKNRYIVVWAAAWRIDKQPIIVIIVAVVIVVVIIGSGIMCTCLYFSECARACMCVCARMLRTMNTRARARAQMTQNSGVTRQEFAGMHRRSSPISRLRARGPQEENHHPPSFAVDVLVVNGTTRRTKRLVRALDHVVAPSRGLLTGNAGEECRNDTGYAR